MAALHTGAFILAFLAAAGMIFATVHNEWKKNSQLDSQINLANVYSCAGLWVRCTSGIKGQLQCDTYETALFALPAHITALRGLMIVSCIFSVLGFAIMGYALDCNANIKGMEKIWARRISGIMVILAVPLQCQRAFMVIATIAAVSGLVAAALGQDCIHAINGKPKVYSARTGGGMVLFAGILTIGAASWYAAEVVREFWRDQVVNASFQYEFGAALYVGWVCGGLALVAGALMSCCTCGDDEDDEYRYTYNPPKAQPNRNTEYV